MNTTTKTPTARADAAQVAALDAVLSHVPRPTGEADETLTTSLRLHGQLAPILRRGGQIVDGHRSPTLSRCSRAAGRAIHRMSPSHPVSSCGMPARSASAADHATHSSHAAVVSATGIVKLTSRARVVKPPKTPSASACAREWRSHRHQRNAAQGRVSVSGGYDRGRVRRRRDVDQARRRGNGRAAGSTRTVVGRGSRHKIAATPSATASRSRFCTCRVARARRSE